MAAACTASASTAEAVAMAWGGVSLLARIGRRDQRAIELVRLGAVNDPAIIATVSTG